MHAAPSMRSKISFSIHSILAGLIVAVTGANLFAIPQDPDISEIVYTNGGKQDSTGYYGYLVGQPGAYSVTADGVWFAWPFYKYSYNYKPNTETYAQTVLEGLLTAAKARAARNLPPLNEDYRLDVAAMMISREMFRQQWIGVDFPDGKTLASFLRAAGWSGDPNSVIAYPTVSDTFFDTFGNGRFNPGFIAKNFPQAVNPAVLTMGYAQNFRFRDLHGNQIGNGRVLANYYEVVLLSTEQVTAPTEAIYDDRKVDRYINQAVLPVPINVVGNKGQRLKWNSIVVSRKQLVGLARLKGRLPAGVHFNAATGAFVGTPHQKGVFRVMISARYRKVGGQGASGFYTSNAILRIRE